VRLARSAWFDGGCIVFLFGEGADTEYIRFTGDAHKLGLFSRPLEHRSCLPQ